MSLERKYPAADKQTEFLQDSCRSQGQAALAGTSNTKNIIPLLSVATAEE